MKVWKTVLKIFAALAALAGIVYVIANYGDRIVACAKKLYGKIENLLSRCGCNCNCLCEDDCDNCPCEEDCDECSCCGNADVHIFEDAPSEESVEEVIPANEPAAEDADFAG